MIKNILGTIITIFIIVMLFSIIQKNKKTENMKDYLSNNFINCYKKCRDTKNCYSFIHDNNECYKYTKAINSESLNNNNIICNKTMEPIWGNKNAIERKKLSYNVCQSRKWKYPKYYYLYNNILYQVSSGENINNFSKVDMF